MDHSALPTVCRGGCGFYGSSATDGFCSKCFKDTLKRKQDTGHLSPTSSNMTPKAVDVGGASRMLATTVVESLVSSPNQASCSAIVTSESIEQKTAEAMAVMNTIEVENSSGGESSPSTPPKQKNRCDNCRKKVGLTGFECRCGGLFCAVHRYSDMHQCSFDYKALGEQEIRKNNPVVKTEKVVKL